MGFEWDSAKASANLQKHSVDFADAAIALEDPGAITIEDPDSDDEERYISLGVDPIGQVLVTVFTYRGDNVRIISARKASRMERLRYENLR